MLIENREQKTRWEKELRSTLNNFSQAKSNSERKDLIKNQLKKIGVCYVCQNISEKSNEDYNICITAHAIENKIVLGAHMDVVEGSSGMNDNLSSIAILLTLLNENGFLQTYPSVEIVFFDSEENGRKGSKLYVQKEKDKVKLMINLDVCGYGEDIVFSTNKSGVQFKMILEMIRKYMTLVELEALPESDNRSFEEQGIESISIALLPKEDIETLKEHADLCQLFYSHEATKSIYEKLTVVKTTHGGVLDKIEVIEYGNMCKIIKFLLSFLTGLKECKF